ncbi:MAG: dienelactone hydrolase family protein [Nitrospirae bacterium]|nr:dienelactone hydrolase family protein [Nitrospirota bacterium]MBF0542695.1 dienelactone hydrolase family protein [Nitrospirota bacterium]
MKIFNLIGIFVIAVLTVVSLNVKAEAVVITELVEYTQGGTQLEGYLAYDNASDKKRPGILVIHEWTGINQNIKQKTEALAKMGYVAFAADIYGKGIRPANNEDAAKQSGIYRTDRALMRARAKAALETLIKQRFTDKTKMAAIGFCFGGTTALELARSGADLRGVVSFHGGLDTPNPKDASLIKGRILILHGADDPYVDAKQIAAFQDEMRSAKVDWEMVYYSGAVHSFTNPFAGNDNSKGAAYNETASQRSWLAMQRFFNDIF